jgi:hypothetical protein
MKALNGGFCLCFAGVKSTAAKMKKKVPATEFLRWFLAREKRLNACKQGSYAFLCNYLKKCSNTL